MASTKTSFDILLLAGRRGEGYFDLSEYLVCLPHIVKHQVQDQNIKNKIFFPIPNDRRLIDPSLKSISQLIAHDATLYINTHPDDITQINTATQKHRITNNINYLHTDIYDAINQATSYSKKHSRELLVLVADQPHWEASIVRDIIAETQKQSPNSQLYYLMANGDQLLSQYSKLKNIKTWYQGSCKQHLSGCGLLYLRDTVPSQQLSKLLKVISKLDKLRKQPLAIIAYLLIYSLGQMISHPDKWSSFWKVMRKTKNITAKLTLIASLILGIDISIIVTDYAKLALDIDSPSDYIFLWKDLIEKEEPSVD